MSRKHGNLLTHTLIKHGIMDWII